MNVLLQSEIFLYDHYHKYKLSPATLFSKRYLCVALNFRIQKPLSIRPSSIQKKQSTSDEGFLHNTITKFKNN